MRSSEYVSVSLQTDRTPCNSTGTERAGHFSKTSLTEHVLINMDDTGCGQRQYNVGKGQSTIRLLFLP